MFNIFILQFGCRVNSNGSCYAIQQSGVLDQLQVAFVRYVTNNVASCLAQSVYTVQCIICDPVSQSQISSYPVIN